MIPYISCTAKALVHRIELHREDRRHLAELRKPVERDKGSPFDFLQYAQARALRLIGTGRSPVCEDAGEGKVRLLFALARPS